QGAFPELIEAGGKAGQGGFEVIPDLAIESSPFADEIAAMADDELQGGPGLVARRFEQGAAGDGGAMDGGEVPVIGLVAGIGGLAILLGAKGMEDACLEASGGEGALHQAVIAAGAFDGDQAITEIMSSKSATDLGDGRVEVRAVVGNDGGGDEHVAVEVGEQELGAVLVAVAADDAKVLGADLLHAGVQNALRLAEGGRGRAAGRTLAGARGRHGISLQTKGEAHPILAAGARQELFTSLKPTYQRI